jgi:hypothetical protein
MDLGLYNKKSEPRGEHGTLIGNWCEERALQQATGFSRLENLALEKKALNQTQDRIIAHRDNADAGQAHLDRISVMKSTFVAHSNDHFTPKIFNQIGSHWHHDEGTITLPAARKDMSSSISFGTHPTDYSSTHSSSFLHPTSLVPSAKIPLVLQATTKFVPRSFPETTVSAGGRVTTKLDRPEEEKEYVQQRA